MTKSPPKRYRKWPVQLAVLAVVAFFLGMARIPPPSEEEMKSLAARFSFETRPLVHAPIRPGTVLEVNKTVSHLRGWMYHMGSTVALADLDGDGLANDLCYNDVAAKALMIAPVPGTGDRYAPFAFDFGPFTDMTEFPMRCGIADMNEDGLADIYVGFAGRAPLLLLRKNTGAHGPEPLSSSSYVIQELIPNGRHVRWHSPTSTFTDLDGDGHLDLIVGNYFPDGANIFDGSSDEPFEMTDTFVRSRNGGKNRVFLWAGATSGDAPTVTYREAANPFPGTDATAWTFALGAADLDRDGLSDLYVSNDFGPDCLYLNKSTPGKLRLIPLFGRAGFATPRSFVLGRDTFKGMGIDFADINRDGVFDMVVSNIANDHVLGESHFLWVSNGGKEQMEKGIAPYQNLATTLGTFHNAWAWDVRFDDFDNDGEMEIVQATGYMKGDTPHKFLLRGRWPNLQQFVVQADRLDKNPATWTRIDFGAELDGHERNPFYVMGSAGKYVDISQMLFPGQTPNTRGIAIADVDGDGRLDLAISNPFEDSLFYMNKSPTTNAFLGLHLLLPLEGQQGSRVHDGHPKWREGTPAVGALVEFTHPDGRPMSRQVDGGNGHSGSRAPDLVFGLGKLSADTPLAVRITWRDRTGTLQHSRLDLKPGWHTVVLAANTEVNR